MGVGDKILSVKKLIFKKACILFYKILTDKFNPNYTANIFYINTNDVA